MSSNQAAHKLKTTHRVGVDAILAQSKAKHRQAERLTDTAFQGDAETLLQEATELVQIIHKYVATLDHSSSSNNKNDDTGDDDSDRLIGLLQDMGMTSALRKCKGQQAQTRPNRRVAQEQSGRRYGYATVRPLDSGLCGAVSAAGDAGILCAQCRLGPGRARNPDTDRLRDS